jgi:hypothetical protein
MPACRAVCMMDGGKVDHPSVSKAAACVELMISICQRSMAARRRSASSLPGRMAGGRSPKQWPYDAAPKLQALDPIPAGMKDHSSRLHVHGLLVRKKEDASRPKGGPLHLA